MPVIRFKREHLSVDVPDGANLRQVALDNGIEVYQGLDIVANCRGRGLCGTCRVEIVDGKGVPPMAQSEEVALVGEAYNVQRSGWSDAAYKSSIKLLNEKFDMNLPGLGMQPLRAAEPRRSHSAGGH